MVRGILDIDIYIKQKIKFPMIASILEGNQEGTILKNSDAKSSHFFVINKFGFCQEFYSKFDETFFEQIKSYIQNRNYKKLRCYAPSAKLEEFLNNLDYASKSERVQIEMTSSPKDCSINSNYKIERINDENIKLINFGLDLSSRYWANAQDFVQNAFGFVVLLNKQPVGCCYSAANGVGKAEIDIFVDGNHRNQKLGYALGVEFIKECQKNGLKPSWDCYSNNTGSVNLAEKLGFNEFLKYNFYNINGSII